MEKIDLLIKNAQIVTAAGHQPPVTGERMQKLNVIDNGWVACQGSQIVAVGTKEQVSSEVWEAPNCVVIDATSKVVTPGLIDPHTHLVFGGSREDEFVLRNSGADYLEILQSGGGILDTVRATRQASFEELTMKGLKYLDWMLQTGTTTVECKSGYGLNLATEIKQLEVAKELSSRHAMDIVPTFLGAHALPPDYKDNPDGYIDYLIDEMLPQVKEAGLAQYCDVFCEQGVFSISQTERILRAAEKLGFQLRLHADEMSSLGGAELAAKLGAISGDHLLQISDQGITALREKGVIPILLPATSFTLRKAYAPARKMLAADLPLALATDFNPGSSPTPSLLLTMSIACLYLQLTPEEAFHAVTINAACALQRSQRIGSIEPGKQGDLVIFAVDNYRKIPYFYGANLVETVIKQGQVVLDKRSLSVC